MLAGALNGNWENTTRLEHFIDHGGEWPNSEAKKAAIVDVVSNSLVLSILGHLPGLWPRHCWLGAVQAVTDIMSLMGMHNILQLAFQRFMYLAGNKAFSGQGANQRATLADDAEINIVDDAHDLVEEDIALAGDEDMQLGHSHQPHAPDTNVDFSFAAHNAFMRDKAWAWVQKNQFGQLLIMKLGLTPLTELLQNMLDLNPSGWESKEQYKVAKCMMSDTDNDDAHRTWRVVVAATHALENDCQMKMKLLFDSSLQVWHSFPRCNYVRAVRSQAFTVLTRICASVFQYVYVAHNRFPLALFKLLTDPTLSHEVVAAPDCIKDPLTLSLQKKYGLQGNAFLAILESIALSMHTDISQVECRHASVRRTIMAKSVHTWRLGHGHSSAMWLMQNSRLSLVKPPAAHKQKRKALPVKIKAWVLQSVWGLADPLASTCSVTILDSITCSTFPVWLFLEDGSAGSKQRVKRAGHGGAWRAFIRLQSSSQGRADFAALAQAYHRMKSANSDDGMWETCERLGKLATTVGKTGLHQQAHDSSFGLVGSETAATTYRLAVEALTQRLSTQDVVQQAESIKALASNIPSIDFATVAANVKSKLGEIKRKKQKDIATGLQQFQKEFGVRAITSMLDVFPSLKHLSGFEFEAIPSKHWEAFLVKPPTADHATKA
eukprot:2908292-Amphidinium_carterae.3